MKEWFEALSALGVIVIFGWGLLVGANAVGQMIWGCD